MRGASASLSGVMALALATLFLAAMGGCATKGSHVLQDGRLWLAAGDHFVPVLKVRTGQRYRIEVQGEWIDWTRKSDHCGKPSLWVLRPFETSRLLPDANWFALGGVIGSAPSSNQRNVRDMLVRKARISGFNLCPYANGVWTAPESGTLYMFANDIEWAYWNNRGHLHVRVRPEN